MMRKDVRGERENHTHIKWAEFRVCWGLIVCCFQTANQPKTTVEEDKLRCERLRECDTWIGKWERMGESERYM